MRSTLEIEGIWEEILANANEFSGRRVRLTLLEKGTSKESELLKEINLGVSADTWTEYQILIAKRQAETLTEQEQQQLIGISDRLEVANVRRMKALIELSNLRGQSLSTVMQELGISESH
jgi:DNA-binding MarR family transcriptional regulator